MPSTVTSIRSPLPFRRSWLALSLAALSSASSSAWDLSFDMGDGLPPVFIQAFTPGVQVAGMSSGRTVLATLAGALASAVQPQRPIQILQLSELLKIPAQLPLDGVSQPSKSMTLEQAIALGVQNSLEVQANAARADSFAHTSRAARGALLPHLDGRAAVGRGRLESDALQPLTDRREGTLTLRQPLFDAGAYLEWRRQGQLSDAAARQLDAAMNDAALETASAYLQALQARMVMELSRDYERLLQELLDHITARAAGGGASVAERDRVRARAANARAQIADSRANLSAALRNLSTLTGVSPDALELNIAASLGAPSTLDMAVDRANQANPELLAARLETDAAKLETQSLYGRFLPRVDLELSHTRNVNGSGTLSYQRDSKAMVVVNWSLLNGSADYYQSRAAQARQQEKLARASDVQRKLRQQFDGAYASLDAIAERIGALREEVGANTSVVEAFRSQLGVGNRSLLDVLDACQRLHQSRLDVAGLMMSELQNHLKVAHLTGRLADNTPDAPTQP
jgi:adhesin transport system outer membrane protein